MIEEGAVPGDKAGVRDVMLRDVGDGGAGERLVLSNGAHGRVRGRGAREEVKRRGRLTLVL